MYSAPAPNLIYPNLPATLLMRNMSLHKTETVSPNFLTWSQKAEKQVEEELYLNVDFVPFHLACFRNFLFCINESDKAENLLIFNLTTNNKIELKNTFKIGVPNIKV